jgi:hypothetical protein
VIQTWKLRGAKANFPMALDPEHHRLFVVCRQPARLVVLNTETGEEVAGVDCAADADDVWYDSTRHRLYVSGGEGAVSVIGQTDADHYVSLGRTSTAPGARTSFFAGDRGLLFVAVPHRGNQKPHLMVLAAEDAARLK